MKKLKKLLFDNNIKKILDEEFKHKTNASNLALAKQEIIYALCNNSLPIFWFETISYSLTNIAINILKKLPTNIISINDIFVVDDNNAKLKHDKFEIIYRCKKLKNNNLLDTNNLKYIYKQILNIVKDVVLDNKPIVIESFKCQLLDKADKIILKIYYLRSKE